MSMLSSRLQILIEVDQRDRLEREARERGTSVATLVREAIDLAFPSASVERRAAARLILDAEPVPVPDLETFIEELDAVRSRRG
jgi:hypothetical protein